jgi:hypothetical protein
VYWLAQEHIGNPKVVSSWETAANVGQASMNMWLPYARAAA